MMSLPRTPDLAENHFGLSLSPNGETPRNLDCRSSAVYGAMGKSAQLFPATLALPDAMEGPTPVSALITRRTMCNKQGSSLFAACRH